MRSAVVGAVLGLVWTLLDQVSWDTVIKCHSDGGFDCMGVGLLLLALLVVASFLGSWLALRLVGVRPAWTVTAVAAFLFPATGVLELWPDAWDLSEWALPFFAATVFATAATLAAPRPLLWRPRIALLLVIALCGPPTVVLNSRQRAERLRQIISHTGPSTPPTPTSSGPAPAHQG